MHNDISNDLVSIEYRDNNRIQVIHINSMTREAVNLYINLIQTEIVSRESPLLLSVHNYQNVGGMVSHYYMERIKEFSGDKIRKDSHGRVGVVPSGTNTEEFHRILGVPQHEYSRELIGY